MKSLAIIFISFTDIFIVIMIHTEVVSCNCDFYFHIGLQGGRFVLFVFWAQHGFPQALHRAHVLSFK